MTHWREVQYWMDNLGGYLLQHKPETFLPVPRNTESNAIQLQTPGDDLHVVRSQILDVLLAAETSSGKNHQVAGELN
jgi:hypothetical protein